MPVFFDFDVHELGGESLSPDIGIKGRGEEGNEQGIDAVNDRFVEEGMEEIHEGGGEHGDLVIGSEGIIMHPVRDVEGKGRQGKGRDAEEEARFRGDPAIAESEDRLDGIVPGLPIALVG